MLHGSDYFGLHQSVWCIHLTASTVSSFNICAGLGLPSATTLRRRVARWGEARQQRVSKPLEDGHPVT